MSIGGLIIRMGRVQRRQGDRVDFAGVLKQRSKSRGMFMPSFAVNITATRRTLIYGIEVLRPDNRELDIWDGDTLIWSARMCKIFSHIFPFVRGHQNLV